ncbi:MAG: hypothetical protein ACPGXL_02805 [Chitinophagales bacterium]
MTQKNEILRELEALAPTLAGLKEHNPFQVPKNYFAHLQDSTLEWSNELESIATAAPILNETGNEAAFQLPQSYFDGLHGAILEQVLPKDEELDTSSIKKASQTSAFALPDNYFNEQHDSLLYAIGTGSELKSRLIEEARVKQCFKIPDNYFEQLHDSILVRLKQEDTTEEISTPNLAKVEQRQTFAVPDNYFEILHSTILTAVKQEAETEEALELISNIGSKVSFKTPPNYFNELHNNIMDKVVVEGKKATGGRVIEMTPSPSKAKGSRGRGIIRMVRYATAVAAVASMVFIGINFWGGGIGTLGTDTTETASYNPVPRKAMTQIVAEIQSVEASNEAIEAFLADEAIYADAVDYASAVEGELLDISTMDLKGVTFDVFDLLPSLDEQAIEDFLEEESILDQIDDNTLIESL